MRLLPRLALILIPLLGLAAPALAQLPASPLATHRPPASATTSATPPHGPAIIPGSALAALTGAPPPPAAPAVPEPFGTSQLGFVITGALGSEAASDFHAFIAAMESSTRLGPVVSWLVGFKTDQPRQQAASAIVMALLLVLLPAALVDAGLRFALRRPAAICAQWALPHQEEFLPDAEAPENDPETAPETAPEDAPAEPQAPRRRLVSLRAWCRRLGFALLKFLLALLPLAGFVITAEAFLLSPLTTSHAGRLAVTGIANAYLLARLAQECLRFVISPTAPALRLVAMPSARAQALMHWLLVVLATIVFAYSLISTAVILRLPHAGAAVLTRIATLIVHIELAWLIWRGRRPVGRWIAGKPKATGALVGLRQRLGQVWHYFALFYVLALWVAWAGGVQNAFSVLLRAVVVFIAALAIGRLAWAGSASLLERLFPDPAGAESRHPALLARARAYNPFLRAIIRGLIAAAVLLAILQGWGVDAWGWLHRNAASRALLGALFGVLVTVTLAIALWESLNAILQARIDRLTATGRTRQATRLRTLAPILRAAIGTLIVLVGLVVCLSEIGVNTTGLLAVSSIAGIAVGFGSQKLVQDIITGLFLLLEDAIQVGDVATLAGMTGTVERLSIRTIRLRGGDGSVNIIPFSSVTTVTNMTRDFNYAEISITVGYGETIDHVCAVLTDIGRDMRAEPAWGALMRDDLQIFGLDKFGELGLVISGQIRTGPGQHWAVRREFYRRVQQRFAAEHISMPFRQQVFTLEMPATPPPQNTAP